jgi:hypothetical protein
VVRYYGYYSNVSRGKRQKENEDYRIPFILEPGVSAKEHRKNWAKLIQKIYEVDPLTCPRCSGKMKIISIIEDEEIIKKILKHLGLWDVKYNLLLSLKSLSLTQYPMITIRNTSSLGADN